MSCCTPLSTISYNHHSFWVKQRVRHIVPAPDLMKNFSSRSREGPSRALDECVTNRGSPRFAAASSRDGKIKLASKKCESWFVCNLYFVAISSALVSCRHDARVTDENIQAPVCLGDLVDFCRCFLDALDILHVAVNLLNGGWRIDFLGKLPETIHTFLGRARVSL
jgi:hypothetical protein